jgi:hypothetical protein
LLEEEKMKKKNKKHESDFLSHARKAMGEARYSKAIKKGQDKVYALRLKMARELIGLNQSDLKGMAQPEVSKIEGRKDLKISTLDKYAKAMGMRVKISLVSEDDDDQLIAIYG